MTLKQAYEGWSRQSQNRDLYLKTRGAFSRSWLMLDMRKQCKEYTKHTLGTALAETRVIESDKAKAASVMVHVLDFANFAEPNTNPKPTFTYSDLMEYTKGALADPEKITDDADNNNDSDNDLDIDPYTGQKREDTEEPIIRVKPIALERRKQELTLREQQKKEQPKEENIMDNKKVKPRGKKPRPCVQIDMATLKPIKTWPSIIEVQKVLGIKNIERAIERKGTAGGYHWCNVGEEADFKPSDKSLKQVEAERKKKEKYTVSNDGTPQRKNDILADNEPKQKPIGITPDMEIVAIKDITIFSNDELIAEMKRRGWKGTLTMTINIEL